MDTFSSARTRRLIMIILVVAVAVLICFFMATGDLLSFHTPTPICICNDSRPMLNKTKIHAIREVFRVHHVTFLINPELKCNVNATLVIVVISAITNMASRHVIRETWGSYVKDPKLKAKRVFMIGRGMDSAVQTQIKMESELYGDIIQTDTIDSYRNLTLKVVAMLQWVTEHCNTSKFVLKSDDDMFINVPNLVSILSSRKEGRFIMGHVFDGAEPIRNVDSKWYTTEEEYNGTTYPKYVSGTAYVLTTSVAHALLVAAGNTKPFWLEDIYITGVCAQKANITHILHEPGFSHSKRDATQSGYKNAVSGHRVTLLQMRSIFRQLKKS